VTCSIREIESVPRLYGREQKARNSGDLNKAPIPRVRVSRSEVYETWKILEHLIEVRKDLETRIAQCAPSGGMTLELNRAYQALVSAIESYGQLADGLEQKTAGVYPPLLRRKTTRPPSRKNPVTGPNAGRYEIGNGDPHANTT
jgi:hypothetical protein